MQRLEIIQGDITKLRVEAIVNAANSSLAPGGGVCGAIHQAAGRELWEECKQLKGCEVGAAKITKGYNLFAKWVIHAVGPVWKGGYFDEDKLLASCYRQSLALVEEYQIKSIAFPAISTGVYRFPVKRASEIAVTEVNKFLHECDSLERVILVCFGQETYSAYLQTINELVES